MKKVTWITSSLSLALIAALSGCGSSTTASQNDQVSISGKAIDPYLRGAHVCLDLNDNGQCDGIDVRTTTDENGSYHLSVAQDIREEHHDILVSDGTDTATGKPFQGLIIAVDNGEGNVTVSPLTTLVSERYHAISEANTTEDIELATRQVAEYLELNASQVTNDIVALADRNITKPLHVALALEAAAEIEAASQAEEHNATTRQEHTRLFYRNLARHYTGNHPWFHEINQTIAQTVVKPILDYNETAADAGQAAADAGTDAGEAAADAGTEAGEAAANAGTDAGQTAANAGTNAGEAAADAGTDAGQAATDAGTGNGSTAQRPHRNPFVSMIAQFTHNLIQTHTPAGQAAADAGTNAGEAAADAGTDAGHAAANAGTDAGEAAADAGVDAGEAAANAGTNAGEAAANAGTNAGEAAAGAGTDAGESAADAGINAGEAAADAGTDAGHAAANAGTNAGEAAANAGVDAGEAAADAGINAGEAAADAGTDAGEAAANAGVDAGEAAANAGGIPSRP